jgi:hypothetical protein
MVLECRPDDEGPGARGAPTLITWEPDGGPQSTPYRVLSRAALRMSGSRLFLDAPREVVLTFERRRLASARLVSAGGVPGPCPVAAVRIGP